ncbi:MAG TPA: hypothetical protein VFA05_03635 [Gaiellaceae bacterium]|nr:hypothetical protein [Gaiellaceae bacterium]
MHRHRLRRRTPSAVAVLCVVLVGCCAASALAAPQPSAARKPRISLAGTWSGHYGGAYTGTFRLHWTQSGSHLGGSITLSNPSGRYSISGSVHGTAITFGAVGAGATYTGTVSGKSMSGTYKTGNGGHGTWSAHKV